MKLISFANSIEGSGYNSNSYIQLGKRLDSNGNVLGYYIRVCGITSSVQQYTCPTTFEVSDKRCRMLRLFMFRKLQNKWRLIKIKALQPI